MAPVPAPAADGEVPENEANAVNNETDASQQDPMPSANESEPLVAPTEASVAENPPVAFHSIVRTFVLSFFSSIIPEAPAL